MAKKKQQAEVIEVRGDLKDGLGEPFISRAAILDKIEVLIDFKSTDMETSENAVARAIQFAAAEVLIEILEGADCGSWGGFGMKKTAKGMVKQEELSHYKLRDRYEWLKSMPLRKMF